MVIFNFATLGFTTQVLAANNATAYSFCEAAGRLFALEYSASALERVDILEFLAGSFLEVLSGATHGVLPQQNAGGNPGGSSWVDQFYDEPSDSIITMGFEDVGPADRGWIVCQTPVTTLVPVEISAHGRSWWRTHAPHRPRFVG